MKQLLILRRTYFLDATIGHLFIVTEDNPVFFTIERPWLDNRIKVSCIAQGEYNVVPYTSAKNPDVWEVTNVPGRSKILIHVANFADQLEGCIAPGLGSGYMRHNKELQKAVTSSRMAIRQMKDILGYPSEFKLKIMG